MKNLLTKTSLILLIALAFSVNVWAQSNPTPYTLSGGSYNFTTWVNTSTAGTYPTSMIFHTTPTLDVSLTGTFDKDWTAAYNLSSGARFNGGGTDGLYLLNTGSTNSGQGFMGEIVLALNTTNCTQTKLTFTGGFVSIAGTSSRQYALRAQYRIGSTGSWIDIVDGSNNPVEYKNTQYLISGPSTPASSQTFSNVMLPSITDNQSLVQIRWIYYQIGTGGGNRPTYKLDDVNVSCQSLIGTPTKLVVSDLIPANPMTNIPFTLNIRATDDNGVPKFVSTNTDIKVLLYWGNGTLAGTLTKTMAAGTNTVSFNDLKYNVAEGMQVKYQAISGMALDSSKYNIYVKQGPTSAKFFDVYPKSYVGIVAHTFTVKILNSDGNPNEFYDFYPVTLTLLSGPGTIGGTTTKVAMDGIATFNDITFSTAGTYVFSATVPGLANPTSVTVSVNAVPTFSEVIIPKVLKGEGTIPPTTGNGRTPQYALINFTGLHPNTEYTYITAGMLAADVPTTYNGAGINLYYNYKTNSYSYTSGALNLTDPNNRSTFKTGASETSKKIWVNLVPSSNSKFNVGNAVVWVVYLGNEYGEQISRNATTSTSLCARYGSNSSDVSGLYDMNSRIPAKNYLVFYDASGAPVTATIVQGDGTLLQDPNFIPLTNQGPDFYKNIDEVTSAWGTFIPNNLATGIAKIEQYDVTGTKTFTWTDDDGLWAGVDTRNSNAGSNPAIAFQTPYVQFTNLASSQNICNTGSFDFQWDYNGVQTLTIQVSSDAGSTWTTIVAGYPASAGHYSWLVQRTTWAEKSLQFRIFSDEHPFIVNLASNVNIYDAPVIDHHSKSDVYCKGSEVTIETVATGTGITFQWYRDGVAINGATLPYLYFAAIDYSNTGIYYCIVSGGNGSGCNAVRTNDIMVYVARPTSIAKQPESMFINLGASARFEIDPAANGIPPTYTFKYQWYADGKVMVDDSRIQGTKSRVLVFNSVVFQDLAKKYSCVVSALCGSAVSDTVMMSQSDLTISTQPKDQRICEGSNIVLTAQVQNSKNKDIVTYWMKGNYRIIDNNRISGASTTTLTINNVNESDMGFYYLVVEIPGEIYKLFSMSASVYVVTVPTITFQTPNQNITEGSRLKLEVISKSTTSVQTVEWSKDGNLITDQTTTTLDIPVAALTDAGTYTCKITNECGTVTSQPIVVKVTPKGISSVEEIIAGEVILSVPVPNPANDLTQMNYILPSQTPVSITLTDMYGNVISNLEQSNLSAGSYTIEINVTKLNLVNGVYFVNLSTKYGLTTQKIVVLK